MIYFRKASSRFVVCCGWLFSWHQGGANGENVAGILFLMFIRRRWYRVIYQPGVFITDFVSVNSIYIFEPFSLLIWFSTLMVVEKFEFKMFDWSLTAGCKKRNRCLILLHSYLVTILYEKATKLPIITMNKLTEHLKCKAQITRLNKPTQETINRNNYNRTASRRLLRKQACLFWV